MQYATAKYQFNTCHVTSSKYMSSHSRRQRPRNYYHHRNDAFSILPVPADTTSGPRTRDDLIKQAQELWQLNIMASPAMGFQNASSPVISFEPSGDYVSIATLTFDVPPGPAFLYILQFDLQSPTTVRLTGQGMESNPVMALSVLANMIVISVLNNGWQSTGPFSGGKRFSIFLTDATSGGPSSRHCTIPTDRFLDIATRNATDGGTLQLFTYTPYLHAPEHT
jgi:hypothetical protein